MTIYPRLASSDVFSSAETAKIIDEEFQNVALWMRRGFISRGTQVAWGRGSRSVFSRFAVCRVAAFACLRKSMPNAQASENTRNLCEEDFAQVLVIPFTKGVCDRTYLVAPGDLGAFLSADHAPVFESLLVLNLPQIKQDVDAAISEFFGE